MSSLQQKTVSATFQRNTISKLGTYSVAMVIGILLLNILAGCLFRLSNGLASGMGTIGLLIGQLCFFVLLFGLRGSNWTDGFLFTCLTMLLGFVAFLFGEGIAMRMQTGVAQPLTVEVLSAAFIFPGAMFAALFPLWLARKWFGWRLERSDRSLLRFPSSIGGLFVNMVILAGIFLLLRAPQVIWGISPGVYWLTCSIVGVVIALVFAGFTLPAARIVNFQGGFLQFASVLLLAGAIWSVIGAIPRLSEALGSSALPSLTLHYSSLAISGLAFAAVLFLGIRAICADGFALQTSESTTVTKATTPDQRRRTNFSIAHAALVIAIAIPVNIYVARVSAERSVLRDAGIKIQNIVGVSGSVLDHVTGEFNLIRPSLSYIRAPDATDADIERIFEVLLSANALDGLKDLNLAGSQVTDNCLPIVGQASNLEKLDVSQTQVTGDIVSQLANLQLEQFFASDLDLTSAAWERLNLAKLRALTVSGSQFSNEEFAALIDQRSIDNLHTLNVSNTEIDDQVLKSIANLLKRSRLNDYGRSIYLSNTLLSDKDITLLEGAYLVDLSGTNITDASLPKLLHIGLGYIILVDTKITAKALLSDPSPGTRDVNVREGHFTPKELRALNNAGFNIREDAEWLK